jgi:hypothetical protein
MKQHLIVRRRISQFIFLGSLEITVNNQTLACRTVPHEAAAEFPP